MRLAGRFSRRVRGWAKKHGIPDVDCRAGERKHEIGEQYLPADPTRTGIFCVLVNRAPAPIWDVQRYGNNGINLPARSLTRTSITTPFISGMPNGDI